MRALIAVALCLLLPLARAAADEKEPERQRAPLTFEVAADEVLAAARSEDPTALPTLAGRDDPDPWLVADELCHRGEHAVAEQFARAAPRSATEGLPAYVQAQLAAGPSKQLHEALRLFVTALQAHDMQRGLAIASEFRGPLDSVPQLFIRHIELLVRNSRQRSRENAVALLEVGDAAQTLGWMARAADAYGNAGATANKLGMAELAERAWRKRLGLERTLGRRAPLRLALYDLGRALLGLGRGREALLLLGESLETWRAGDGGVARGWTLFAIANAHVQLEGHELAIDDYEAALATFRAEKFQDGILKALLNLGITHQRIDNHREAIDALEEVQRLVGDGGPPKYLARIHGVIGTSAFGVGDFAEGFRRLDAALAIFRRLHDPSNTAGMLNNLALNEMGVGCFDDARAHLHEALGIARALEDRAQTALVRANLGRLEYRCGDYEAALGQYEAALETQRLAPERDALAGLLGSMGICLTNLNRLDEALERLTEARRLWLELGRSRSALLALGNMARVHEARGDYETALAEYRKLKSELGPGEAQARVRWGIGRVHVLRGEYQDATEALKPAVDWIVDYVQGTPLSSDESAGLREQFTLLFALAYLAASRAGRASDLLRFSEQGRAGALRQVLGSSAALESAVLPPGLRAQLGLARREEQARLHAYQASVRSRNRGAAIEARAAWKEAGSRVEQVWRRVEREARDAAALVKIEVDDLAAIQSRLQPGQALVYYGLTDMEASAIVVRRGSIRIVKLADSASLVASVEATLAGPDQVVPEKLAALRKQLVDPLELGSDVREVLISPMGRLGYVPFSVLFEKLPIAMVPSATTLGILLAKKPAAGRGVLALGDPAYGPDRHWRFSRDRAGTARRLASLPATRLEVEAVADVKALGTEASESGLPALLASRPHWRAIHFACHGLVDVERPMASALALTADEHNDGFLTAREVLALRFEADLAVLSACDTGRGKIYRTEGIVGLTRAFMFAGAPRVLCSLWKVDDEATRALMVKFYELWNPKNGSKGLGAAVALRQAQDFVRSHEKWKHPYYWAAWVLWGLP